MLVLPRLARAESPPPSSSATLVKDISPTPPRGLSYASVTGNAVTVGDTLFFIATDDVHGYELWKSDGTAAGTTLVKDVRPGNGSGAASLAVRLVNVGGRLFFNADDGLHGNELWTSDGTAAGTRLVSDLRPGLEGSAPSLLVPMGGAVFFFAQERADGRSLWRSDGTAAGTSVVKALPLDDTRGPISRGQVRLMTSVNGTLFFTADDGVHGHELWKSDGTPGGTLLFRELGPGREDSRISRLLSEGGVLYFTVSGAGLTDGLWRSDGTEAGTFQLLLFANPGRLASVNGTLLFIHYMPETGFELWGSDGTPAGTRLVQDLRPGPDSGFPFGSPDFAVLGGVLYFFANDGVAGEELWRSDGTGPGTFRVRDLRPGPEGSGTHLSWMRAVNGTLLFAADDGAHGVELWKSGGTEASTSLVKDILVDPGNAYPASFALVNGMLYFTAQDEEAGRELWRSDGSWDGTVRVRDLLPGAEGSHPDALKAVNGSLFFSSRGEEGREELWKSDGTEAGTVRLRDDLPGSRFAPGFLNPSERRVDLDGTLFLITQLHEGGETGIELWKSDGTEAGTTRIKQLLYGGSPMGGVSLIYTAHWLTAVNGTLFFAASDNGIGLELWKSDGTEAGTVRVKEILPGPEGSNPSELTAVNGTLFFIAKDESGRDSLWKSDGTEEGTVRVKDVRPHSLTVVNGILFFAAGDAEGGFELWKSDGTEAGTVRVRDIRPGPEGSMPSTLTPVGALVFFIADDGTAGHELWKSDGAEAGTVRVRDIRPGPEGSIPTRLTAMDGGLVFTADDGARGRELWTSDGTERGTRLLEDVTPGASSTPILSLMPNGHQLFFTRWTEPQGWELWRIRDVQQGPIDEGHGCGCSAMGAGPALGWGLLLLLGRSLRRGRRR